MKTKQNTYAGTEKRHYQRRENHDRREMIRFEPNKEQRRSGQERRSVADIWSSHNRF